MTKTLLQSVNDPKKVQEWIISQSRHIPTNKLKDCTVSMTHTVRNSLFTTLGVAGGERPVLFGIPVKLLSGPEYDITLIFPE